MTLILSRLIRQMFIGLFAIKMYQVKGKKII